MGKYPTYSLKQKDELSSDKYYDDIAVFTDEVIHEVENKCQWTLADFMNYVKENGHEKLRNKYEYEVELLMLGCLWNEYIKNAMALNKNAASVLSHLGNRREKNETAKFFSDFARGILETLYLKKKIDDSEKINKNFENVDKLIMWLSAAGDFKYYVERLSNWKDYFAALESEKATKYISDILGFADWFKKTSDKALYDYTKGVNDFLKGAYASHKCKEDFISCGQGRLLYHMNMVGAQMLNRAFREDFLKTKEKWVLVPACMRFHNDKKCQACNTKNGYECKRCSPLCNVNKLTKMGKKQGFKVYIIPHESVPFARDEIKEGSIGIVGIACILNLISGGLKAKELGFVPQCVLLDYCGCRKHWDENGIMTEINEKRLMMILQKYDI